MLHCRVGAPANTTGKTLTHKSFLENRIYDLKQCMVDNPIPETRCGNQALFRFIHIELPVGFWDITVPEQIVLEDDKIDLQVSPEF
jgi:hypothetical protein